MSSKKVGSLLVSIALLTCVILPGTLSHTPFKATPSVETMQSSNSSTHFLLLTGNVTRDKSAYSHFINEIRSTKQYFEFESTSTIRNYSMLEDTDVFILLGIEELEDSGVNINLIEKFLLEGGSLLLGPSYRELKGVRTVLKRISLNVSSALVKNNDTGKGKLVLTNKTWNRSSFLYKGISKVVLNYGIMLQEAKSKEQLNFTLKQHPTLWGNNATVLEGQEKSGKNISLVYECESGPGGRIAVLSSLSMLTDEFFSKNEEFIVNVIHWLAKMNQMLVSELNVQPSKVYLDENTTINVSFHVVNENYHSVNNVNLTVVVERLGESIVSSQVNLTSNPQKTQIKIPSNTKKGTVYLGIQAYKVFYGYTWSKMFKIVLYESWLSEISLLHKMIAAVGFGIPLLISGVFIFKTLSEYRKNRKDIKKVERNK